MSTIVRCSYPAIRSTAWLEVGLRTNMHADQPRPGRRKGRISWMRPLRLVRVYRLCFAGARDLSAACSGYLMISVMVPAPTVRPPSRMAKRRPFSIATGVCSVISSEMLSPGITISVPAGSFAEPVTSVVRK